MDGYEVLEVSVCNGWSYLETKKPDTDLVLVAPEGKVFLSGGTWRQTWTDDDGVIREEVTDPTAYLIRNHPHSGGTQWHFRVLSVMGAPGLKGELHLWLVAANAPSES